MQTNQLKSKFLIVGSGIAGLSSALKAADIDEVILVEKGNSFDNNSYKAQGGIAAAVEPFDTWERHYRDTVKAGGYHNNPLVTQHYTQSAPYSINELKELGCNFDSNTFGYDVGNEGGHSASRIVHRGDNTGRAIIEALREQIEKRPNVQIISDFFAKDLIIQENGEETNCNGITGHWKKDNAEYTITADNVILCTGGAAKVFAFHSNGPFATGDGFGMALRVGIKLRDMQYVQFHPTVCFLGEEPFLVTEAARGLGGTLINEHGEPFMVKYHPKGDLATRDIISRSMWEEMSQTNTSHVYLDLTHLPEGQLREKLPGLMAFCEKHDLHPGKTPIPISPGAHYFCGGIPVDLDGKTAIKGLFAAGENSYTGFHGANRLASNSLLEGWETGRRAPKPLKSGNTSSSQPIKNLEPYNVQCNFSEKELRDTVWKYAGIIRNYEGLRELIKRVNGFKTKVEKGSDMPFSQEDWEKYNLLQTAEAIAEAALHAKTNAGCHYNASLAERKVPRQKKAIP